MADPFGTAGLRERVLAAWSASPARLREDANAEEDLALGGYRDRLVVELAQNAADAAARAGVPGRLLLRLDGNRLVAANTGAPLDAAGVQGLATLRASAKDASGASVGRFGVGFAAVLAASDEPAVASRATGGVRFSRARTRGAAGAEHVPVLRLPWPADVAVPHGYDTVVDLPLRPGADPGPLLDAVGGWLLLVLPGLAEVAVERDGRRRVLAARHEGPYALLDDDGATTRWRVHRASGRLDPALLADRPTEERARRDWSLAWAVALEGAQPVVPPPGVAPVLHAPTPSDEPLGLPALLVAPFPLDPSRRHVAPGPLADHLVERAGAAYGDLARALAADGADPAPLVPSPAAVLGALDTALRRAVLRRLEDVPLLASAEDPGALVAPSAAVVVEGAGPDLVAALAPVLGGLVRTSWPRAALAAVGVRPVALADVVDQLAGLQRPPGWWHDLYAALAAGGARPDDLGALPVPLADGRLVRGPAGTLLPDPDGAPAEALRGLPLRVVDPGAAHPLLERLGARRATVAAVLDDPALAGALRAAADDGDTGPGEAVLGLLAADPSAAGPWPWTGEPLLPGEDGPARADELVVPGSAADGLLTGLGRAAAGLVAAYGEDTLARAGAVTGLGLLALEDVELGDALEDAVGDPGVDGLLDWVDDARDAAGVADGDLPPLVPGLVLVRDLDLVDPARWGGALDLLARPPLRAAVLDPVRVVLPGGRVREVPPYAAWWVREHALVGGRPTAALRLAGSDPLLEGLYEDVPAGADEELLRAVGVRTSLAALLAEPGGPDDLLRRVLDADLTAARVRALHAALAAAGARVEDPPARVRVPDGDGSRAVDADDVVVADGPQWLQLRWAVPPLAAPRAAALADALDVDLCSERREGRVTSTGTPADVPPVVARVLPGAPGRWTAHDDLEVDGEPVDWWVDGAGVHAATTEGLAAGLAWAAAAWPRRHLVAAALADPARADALLADAAWD
ncbi:sacsin N-terminal ATP-binding-like domain-containing protein [Vallicoccus soli]|uniref:sacsin N-terminal ATP-binding-like domain-containing protein n=1 Tax=Vallicoccus soli TaxID=2339232 RepID=UPI001C499369|nr:hypothetical protein [Vallicoccus soli]